MRIAMTFVGIFFVLAGLAVAWVTMLLASPFFWGIANGPRSIIGFVFAAALCAGGVWAIVDARRSPP
jgi:hypothetical protein